VNALAGDEHHARFGLHGLGGFVSGLKLGLQFVGPFFIAREKLFTLDRSIKG
jgi:hypothetical protein